MPEIQVSAVLSQSDLEEVLSLVSQIKQKLPFLLSMTSDQRRSLPRAGDRNRPFVLTAMEIATQNPGILPPLFSLEEMRKDVDLGVALQSINLAVNQLATMLKDTEAVVNGEAYTAALSVYTLARAMGGEAALKGGVEEMGRNFNRRPRASSGSRKARKPKGEAA
ncbi:MAG: hypothetical protein ACKV2V_28245 [Blastocatellia bacterium]